VALVWPLQVDNVEKSLMIQWTLDVSWLLSHLPCICNRMNGNAVVDGRGERNRKRWSTGSNGRSQNVLSFLHYEQNALFYGKSHSNCTSLAAMFLFYLCFFSHSIKPGGWRDRQIDLFGGTGLNALDIGLLSKTAKTQVHQNTQRLSSQVPKVI